MWPLYFQGMHPSWTQLQVLSPETLPLLPKNSAEEQTGLLVVEGRVERPTGCSRHTAVVLHCSARSGPEKRNIKQNQLWGGARLQKASSAGVQGGFPWQSILQPWGWSCPPQGASAHVDMAQWLPSGCRTRGITGTQLRPGCLGTQGVGSYIGRQFGEHLHSIWMVWLIHCRLLVS